MARRLGQYSAYVDAPRHLYFFTPETLRAMLRQCGFRVQVLARVPWLGVFRDAAVRGTEGRVKALAARPRVGRVLWWGFLPASLLLAVVGINRGNMELIAEMDGAGETALI